VGFPWNSSNHCPRRVSTVKDCFDVTVTAFNFSENSGPRSLFCPMKSWPYPRKSSPAFRDGVTIVNRIRPTVPANGFNRMRNTRRGPPEGDIRRRLPVPHHRTVHDSRGFPTDKKEEIKTFYERIIKIFPRDSMKFKS
jgi:hypothetical protein